MLRQHRNSLFGGVAFVMALATALWLVGSSSLSDGQERITVDHDQPLKEVILQGSPTYLTPDFIEEKLVIPQGEHGKKTVVVRRFNFPTRMTSQQVTEAMAKEGFRPAGFYELEAFDKAFPRLQFNHSIVALRDSFEDGDEQKRVPGLWAGGGSRRLNWFVDSGDSWDRWDVFLGVREE